jgi:hypothetical protein
MDILRLDLNLYRGNNNPMGNLQHMKNPVDNIFLWDMTVYYIQDNNNIQQCKE